MPDDRPRLCRVAGRDTWHIYYQRRRLSTGCTGRAEAEAVLASFLTEQAKPQIPISGTKALLALYLADREDAAIPGLDRLKFAHMPLVRHFGERPAEAIDEAACRLYARKRKADGVAASTARTELQALRAALRWAHKKRLIANVPPVVLPPRAQPRDRWLTRDEAKRLADACASHHVRLFVQIALNTASRKGAILELTWDRVNLETRLIDFRGPVATNKRRVQVPINDTLLAELVKAKAGAVTEWVIEWAGGPVASVKHAFRDACARAGLAGVTPHVLRHTAATWLAQDGISIWRIAGMLGHSSPTMVEQTYGHHSPDHLRDAADALG